ncbi:adenylosuccinate lyase [Clostridiaceae bacterium HSG29]|nr:adenylosuccinate lyase [Clostridiaceae bacterium HSG29]
MYNKYQNPLETRYSSKEMQFIFSPQKKFSTWRKLWVALAESEMELGINITEKQVNDLRDKIEDIDFNLAAKYEKKLRHDVMAHIHAYGEQVPTSRGIIHLGATSAFVGDNTDIIVIKEGLELTRIKLVNLLFKLKEFALEYKALPTLGFTHFQPAQPLTVGKRATLWMQDLIIDYYEIDNLISNLKLRGVKGTTGTQASFLELFNNDNEKVKELDKLVCNKLGFEKSIPVSGQTYTRKIDTLVINSLSNIAQSLHKMTNDLRLLQHLKEIEEPFGKNQIGSSAMAYKRNPMRSERIASLSRHLIALSLNPQMTQSSQWFERTLDDSAIRRITIGEGFLTADAILDIANNVTSNLVVYDKVITQRLMSELPFMATENILMKAVEKGGDRQELHEKIRVHSMEAGKQVKVHGKENDLLSRIAKDETFNLNDEEISKLLDPSLYIGRSIMQVDEFISNEIDPIIEEYKNKLGNDVELNV